MPIDNTKLKQLYDTLKQGGYKKDYNNFRTKFLGNENYPYRQKVFNLLSENGEDYGSSYGEFMQRMQVAKPTAAASAAPKQPQLVDTLSTIQSARDTIFNPKAAVQPGGKVAQQAVKDEQTQDDAATKPFDVNQANAFVENMRLQNEAAQRQHQNVNGYLQQTAGQFGKNATRLGFKGQSNLGLPLAPKNQDGAFIDALGREYENETEARLAQTGAQHAREALTEANMQHNDPKNYLLEQKARIEKELNARSSQLEGATDRVPSFATGVAGNAMTQAAARLTDKLQDTKYKALTMQLDKVNQALDTLDEAEHAKASDQWIADSSNWIERAGKNVLSFGAATGRSFKRQASKLSNWDFGFSDLAGGLAIFDAVDKADKGGVEALSPEQRKMLDLYAYNNHIQGENKEHLGWGNTAGTVTAQAVPFMLEMALNPASGVGKFAQRKAMQWAVKKYGKEKLKQLAKRYLLAKAGTRIAGDWLGAATMSATTGQARVPADAVQRRIGEVETDIDNFGRVTYGGHKNGVDWGEAFGKAFLSNTIENQTEMAGDYFGIIGKAFSKGGQKALDKIGLGFVNDFMRNVSSTKVAKAVTDFENATHWNGTTGEYLEEVLGNVENALMVGDSTFDTDKDTGVFNVDKNIETFLSVAVMGGFFSAVKTASYTAPKKRALNEMADIGRQIDGMLGNNNAALEQWGTWRNTFINGTDEEKKQTLREVMDNQQLPIGFRMAFLEYTKAAQKYHGIAQAEQKRAEEGTLDPIGQALDQAYEEGYGTTEPTERQKAYRRLNEIRSQVAQLLELEEGEDLDEAMGNDPIGYIHTLEEQGFTSEQIQPVLDYANAQATYEGMMQQREDRANEQADAVKREVRQITHRQTGQIQKATLDGGEREVYVLNGKVVLYPDGTGVDKQESDDVLYVQDVQTGELFTIAPNRISELAEATDPQAVIAEREEAIAAATNQEIEQEEGAASGTAAPTEAPEVRIPAPRFSGARVTLDLPNGSSVNGVVLQETDDGVEVQTDSPVNGRFVQVFPTDEFDGMLSSVRDEADDVIWSREVAEGENAANGQQREMQGNGIPVDAKTGEPVYEAVAPDVAWDAIVQEAEGDEAMAMQVVTDMVADMEAKVQKAKKAKVRAGSTVRERLEAQKKHKRQIEEAEAQLEAWRRIAAVKAERIAAAERAKIEAAQQREVTQDDETEVPDFVFDKPENARERGYRMQNGQRADRQEPIAAAVGKEVSVKFTHKVSQPVRVAVVDARSLQPSHQNGQPNVLHFLPEAQPKKRTDHESVHAAEQMAAQMNPEEITSSVTAYTGAPSVNARGEVIQGNNRTAALKRMWQGYPEQAAAYKQYLMDHASEYGLNPEDIAAMEQPVLVNLMDVTDEQAIELGQYDVKDTESGGTERIKPRNVSQKMGDKAERFASILLRTTDEDASVSQLIDEHAVETLKWLEAQHYISPTQYRSAFNADGQVTPEAKNDLRGILYQAVFKNGSERLEDMFNALPAKAQRAILATAYRDFSTPESEKMLPEIQNSIVAFYELSQDAAFANAKNFEEARKATMAWLQQMQFDFSTGQSVSREGKYTNFALTLAAMYKVQTQTAIQQTFNEMFDLLQGRQQPDLLFNPNPNNTPRTLAEAIREVLNIEYDGTNGSHALGGNNETRTTGRQGSARDDSAGGTDAPGNAAADAEGGTVQTDNERGRQRNLRHTPRREKNNLSKTEELKFSEELDQNGHPFILSSDGTTVFGEITKNSGLTAAPIKLNEGFNKTDEEGNNIGYGLLHIQAGHGQQILEAGYPSVQKFVEDVCRNYKEIRIGRNRKSNQTYMLLELHDEKHKCTLYVELSHDGTYWNVNSGGIFRNKYTDKNDIVWPEPTVGSNANTDTAEVANNPTEVAKGETVDRGGNSSQPISSESKDTPQNSAVQTSGQENAETSLQSEVTRAEQQTNAEPTEGQKEAGNYKKGRVKVGPFDVVIEQPRGSVRSGVDANGKAWETTMQNTYGYFGGTKGVDGDAIDVFLAHNLDEWDGTTVFVVDQYNPDGSFDEHKVMLGFNSQEEAEAAYFANYESDWAKTHRTEVTAVPLADFTEWVKSSKRKTKAFAEYKVSKRNAEIDAHNAQNEQLAEQLFSMAKEAETEKDFFDRAASLFEVTGYESDLRDIYNGVKSGEIANARALSFYTNATLKPVKEGVKVKAPKSEQKQKAEAPRQSGYERKHWHADSSLEEMLAREKYLQNAMSFGTKEMAEVFPMAEEWQRDREELKAKYGNDLKNALPNDVKKAFLKKHKNTFANQTALNDELYELRSAIISHKEKAASRAEAAAKEQKAEEANKRFGDFLNGKTPLRRASIVKALTRVSNFGKEGSMTMAQFIEKHVAEGTLELRTKEVDKLQGPSRRQLNRMDASQQAQAENRVKQAGKKTEYLINGFVANKTAYEYAEHLLATKKGKAGEKARKHAAQPGASAVSTQEAMLRDALVDVAQQSGLEVVVDEKAQQVLDEVNGRARTMAFGEEYDYDRYPEGRVEPNIADKYVHIERAKLDHGFANFNEAKEWAKSHIVRTLDNEESGGKGNVKISSTAVNKYLSESAVAKSDSKDVHLAVLKKLPEIIHDSVDVETTPDFKKDENGVRKVGNEINKNVLIHRCYGAVEINGNIYRVKITLKEYKDKNEANKAYSYEATKIELFAGTLANDRKTTTDPGTNDSISVAKLLKDVEMSYRPGVKVLEESAKQRARLREHRVFHGSGAEFDAFDHSHMGEGEGAQAYGWGTYVTEVEGIGRAYARNPWQMKINELESNISRAKEKLPFMPPSATKTELENNIKEWEEELAKLENGNKHLYTVEIPEDNGTNYLHWEKPLTREQIGRITEKLKSGGWNVVDGNHPTFEKNGERIVLNERAQGQDVYAELEEALGSDKVASEFLASIGFTGISYPAEALSGGRKDAARNFVIFNEKDAQITDHIRFFRTPGGEAYGFTVDGKIYLDPRIATAETPIHEYAHLWADMIRNVNTEAWNDIVGLMKATPIWEEVRGLYPELKTDDEIADEVLAHYSGRRGAERLREAQQQAAAETGKSVFERAAAVAAIERVKQALAKFWQSVAELFHIRFTSAEEVADRVLADMLNGVNPMAVDEKGRSLAGIHNISEEKLGKALKMGGLANPSLAVIDMAQGSHEGYGEISLIAPSALIDKKKGENAGTFSGDAWTPTYPQVERQFSGDGSSQVYDDLSKLPEAVRPVVRTAWNSYMDGRDADGLAYQFLHEKGMAPEIKKMPTLYPAKIHQMIEASEALEGDAKEQAILDAYIESRFEGSREKFNAYISTRKQVLEKKIAESPVKKGIMYNGMNDSLAEINERGYEARSLYRFASEVKADLRRKGSVDADGTVLDAINQVRESDNLSKEYNKWRNELEERYGIKEVLFSGYAPDGSRTYLPHTLENVSNQMKKAGLAAATGWNGSFSKFAAGLMKNVGTLSAIRKQKGKLTPDHENVESFRKKWEDVYFNLGIKLNPGGSAFDDTGLYRLEEVVTKSNPKAFAKKEYGVELSEEDVQQMKDMVNAIREEYPAMYFETKFERPVRLEEFAAAVVPADASEETKGALRSAGLKLYEYDSNKSGDRKRAMTEAVQAKGIRFQFVGQQGAAALDKAEEATTRLDNLGVAREMERQEKDAKAIKLATGWERGGDGKWRYEIMDGELKKEPNVKEKVSSDGEVHYETTLGEILDNEQLYRSYPELRTLPVSIQQMDGGVSGIYLPSGYMSLSMGLYRHRTQPGDVRREIEQIESTPEYNEYSKYFEGDMPDAYIGREDEWEEAMNEAEAKFFESELGKRYHDLMWGDKRKAYSYGFDEVGKGVILHEVQHAIQHIEGFAMGGNSTTYREHLAGFREKYEAWSVIDEFEDKSKELGDDARPIDVYNALVREYQSLGLEFGDGFAPSREAFDKGFNLWTRGYDNEGYEDAYNEYQRLMGKFGSGEYNNRYDQLAGEVEARNVQNRLHMTPEERRQSLAEETEDVAREDQIFIMDGIEGANSLGDSASFDEHQNEDLKAVNERFNEKILSLRDNPNQKNRVVSLGRAGHILQLGEIADAEIILEYDKLVRKSKEQYKNDHPFDVDDILNLPLYINDPIAIFTETNKVGNSSQVILTELKKNGRNFIVVVKAVEKKRKGGIVLVVNNVTTLFPKEAKGIIYWLNQKKATYVNREKALRFIEALQNHSETKINSKELEDAAKVVENPETSQGSAENNFREGKGELSDDMLSYLNDPMAQMMGKPRGTKKQRAQFAERERGRMQAHAEKLVERLHLTNVEIVTDASQLEGKQRTAKGFYNKRTGKITIVLPNHASTADVEQTLLHEAVAHYGLRQLFGEHFDDFLDMVYRNAEEGIRRKIAEASAKHGWNVRTATEEYLADLAERTDFEHASPQWWAKIKGFFLDMLRGLGFEAMDGQTLTDNELRYVLWRSYENLTEPGKYPTFIAEARDVAKQHALQVGRFAPTETAGSRVAENEALSEEETAEILFRDGNDYQYTQALARDRYERRIKSGMYQTQEALQDSMLGLRTAMESILEAEGRKGVYIEDIDGFENAYLGENRLSSVNQAEAEKFAREVFAPMLEEVSKLAPTAEERAKLIDYLFAKHGLERNEVMARRAAAKEARKEFEKELRTAARAVAKDPLDQDAEDALDDVKQRMQEREDALYSENRQKTDYAGLTTLTGKAAVADAELMAHDMVDAYENAHDTNALWDAINTVTQGTLKKSFDTGMISRDTYDDIRSMYQFYIPLRGFDERTSNEEYAYLGGTESVFTSPIKTAMGRRSKADDPLAYMQMMAESAIAQGNRNQLVKQKLLNFALNHPSDLISVSELWLRRDPFTDQWSVVQPGDLPGTDKLEDSDTAEMVSQKMEQFEQVMQQLMVQNPDDFVRQKDRPDIPYRVVNAREMQQHQVMVKRNGKTYVLTINGNPRAAQAVNGLTNPNNDMSGAIGVMARSVESANRWLSSVYTTRNPDFVLTNLARDAGYTNTMVWLKEDSSYAVNFNRNYATRANLLNMIRLYSRLMNGKLDLTDPTEMLFSQFISNGGETGYTAMRDLDAHKTKIKKELKKLSSDPSVRKVWNASFDMLDLFNKAGENSARFAAFITSREAGRTLDRSIYDAKEISVNFNKKGAGAKFLDSYGAQVKNDIRDLSWKNPNLLKLTKDVAIYQTVFLSGVGRSFFAFWNAAIQGSTNFGRVVKRHSKKALTAMAIMFALGLANAMVGASGDDDDDAEEGNGYFDHPSNTRRSNLMLRINGKSWASIPLPVEYRAVYGMGELLGSVMSGKERYTNQELAHEVLCQVSQVLPLDVVGEGSGAFVPTFAKPAFEVLTNESWTGLPIYKQTAYNERDPAYTKAYSNTNKQLVGLSKMLNELSGGDSQKSGWLDVNPSVIEHLGRGYLGGYFNLVDKLVKTGETVVGSREYDPSNLLIVNRFVKSGSERTAYRAINNRYYQIKADSEELIKDYKGYNYETKTGKRDYSQKIAQMNGSPELLSAMAAHEYITEVDKYHKALKSEQDEVLKKRMEKELYELKSAMIHTVDSILDQKQTLRKAE